MTDGQPCPRCDRPIADTGYVCHACARELTDLLRWGAEQLDDGELDTTIGRQTRTSLGVIAPRPVDRAVYAGPWCWGGGHDCGHDSCRLIWFSIVTHRIEDPLPHEDAGVINLGASEHGWIVDHTARAWAQFIHDERGSLIPVARPPREPLEQLHALTDSDKQANRARAHEWCIYGDLPAAECGCGNPNATHPRNHPIEGDPR